MNTSQYKFSLVPGSVVPEKIEPVVSGNIMPEIVVNNSQIPGSNSVVPQSSVLPSVMPGVSTDFNNTVEFNNTVVPQSVIPSVVPGNSTNFNNSVVPKSVLPSVVSRNNDYPKESVFSKDDKSSNIKLNIFSGRDPRDDGMMDYISERSDKKSSFYDNGNNFEFQSVIKNSGEYNNLSRMQNKIGNNPLQRSESYDMYKNMNNKSINMNNQTQTMSTIPGNYNNSIRPGTELSDQRGQLYSEISSTGTKINSNIPRNKNNIQQKNNNNSRSSSIPAKYMNQRRNNECCNIF